MVDPKRRTLVAAERPKTAPVRSKKKKKQKK
jgi:hypothetical protein